MPLGSGPHPASPTSTHLDDDNPLHSPASAGEFFSSLLDFVYRPLYDLCARIPADSSALLPALWQCWSFVDIVHRIREIAQAIPGLSRKDRHLKSFLESTSTAEEFRHYIQHLRMELSKKQTNPFPVWGTLAWVDRVDASKSYAVMIGARLPGTSYTGCVFDRFNWKWVSKVSLGVANKSLNFDVLYDAAVTFREYIVPWTLAAYQPGIKMTAELPIVTIEIKPAAAPQSEDGHSET